MKRPCHLLPHTGISGPLVRHSRHSRRSGNPEPFLPPNPSASLQEWSRWDVDLSTRRALASITILAHDGSSGFPLRRE